MTTISNNNQNNGKDYTAVDDDQFSALMDQLNHYSVHTSAHENEPKTIEPVQTDYSEADQDAFSEIMANNSSLGKSRNAEKNNSRQSHSIDGYTTQDNRQFDALMEFGSDVDSANFWYSGDQSESGRTVSTISDPQSTVYTEQDLQAFAHLSVNSVNVTTGNETSNHAAIDKASTDRDVGPIKIIDFDQQRSAKARSKEQRDENIKVRFFD